MKFDRNMTRLRKRAAIDVAKKLRLEPHLNRDLRKIFRHMISDFRNTYPRKQITISPDKYKTDFVAILRNHYRKVVKSFLYSARDELNSKSMKVKVSSTRDRNIDQSVKAKLGQYILVHSEEQAKVIIRTTEEQLNDSITRVIEESLLAGQSIDSQKIADLVATDYLKKIKGRSETIAITETQSLSERVKQTELEELVQYQEETQISDELEEIEPSNVIELQRVWVAILDNKTRDAHAEADGQEVGFGEPFNVGGEELEYPGDPKGSAENIINCRCVAIPITG